jgi:hypothetical protein
MIKLLKDKDSSQSSNEAATSEAIIKQEVIR